MSAKKPRNSQRINRAVIFDEQFRQDLGWWYRTNRRKAFRLLDLVEAVTRDPFKGIGKPEPLKHLALNVWSRRIDLEHRLVYRETETRLDFLQARYQY